MVGRKSSYQLVTAIKQRFVWQGREPVEFQYETLPLGQAGGGLPSEIHGVDPGWMRWRSTSVLDRAFFLINLPPKGDAQNTKR